MRSGRHCKPQKLLRQPTQNNPEALLARKVTRCRKEGADFDETKLDTLLQGPGAEAVDKTKARDMLGARRRRCNGKQSHDNESDVFARAVRKSSPSPLFSSCSCIVEGEAELTAQLSDKRAQSSKVLNSMTMTCGMERVGGWVGTWVGSGRVPCDYSKDSRDSAPWVPRLRTAPEKLADFPVVVRQTEFVYKSGIEYRNNSDTTSSQRGRR